MGGDGSKVLVWLHGEVRTPPFSSKARRTAGFLLRLLQEGETIPMPHCRPMPTIGPRCHELRIPDKDVTWRIIYRVDDDAIVLAESFKKKSQKTPKAVIEACRDRLKKYDLLVGEDQDA